MTADEHCVLVAKVRSGSLIIGMDRAVARKLFLDVPISLITEQTGEKPYFQKAVVYAALIGGLLALVSSCIMAVFAFRWWALLVVPMSVVIYFINSGLSSMPNRGMVELNILLGFAICVLLIEWFSSIYAAWFLVLFVAAIWCVRFAYWATVQFAHALILRNRRAFELLESHIHLKNLSA